MAKKSKKTPTADGLPAKFTDALTRHLGRLAEADKAAAADAVRYVTGGTPEDFPLTLGKVKEAGKLLGLAGVNSGKNWSELQHVHTERLKVFKEGRTVPAAVWQRFGEVLAAAGRASKRKLHPPAGWPEWLQALVAELLSDFYQAGRREGAVWPLPVLDAVFAEAGRTTPDALRVALDRDALGSMTASGIWYYGEIDAAFDGWPAFLAAHLDAVRDVLKGMPATKCVEAIQALGRVEFDFTPVLDLVADLATGPSKTVRDALLPVLLRSAAAAYPHVEGHLTGGDAGRRNEAAAVLWRLDPAKAADRLRAHLDTESAERVKQTIQKLLAAPADTGTGEAGFNLPPLKLELGVVPFPEAARARVKAFFDKAHEQAVRQYEQEQVRWNAPDRPKWMSKPTKPKPLGADDLAVLFEFVEGRQKTLKGENTYRRPFTWNATVVDDSFAPPGVHLIHVVRLCYALDRLDVDDDELTWYQTQDLDTYRGLCPAPFGLREVDAAVASLPKSRPGLAVYAYLVRNSRWGSGFCDWEPAAVWPAFAEHLDVLRDTLTGVKRTAGRDYGEPTRRQNAFRVLAMFPHLPPGFMSLLWDLALGESKTERPLAQAALRTVPGKAEKILVALADGRQGVRAAAAEWLGSVGDPAAIDPLKAAFRKEKLEVVKGVLMAALEKLGADVSEFLDRKALLKEAEAGLAKVPPHMNWFPLDRLPAVRWQDTDKPVDPKIVKWWLVQSVQQKTPVCGPILRRYLELCRPADTAELARFVLSAWIAHDTRLTPAEEAAERAGKDAAKQWKSYGQHAYYREMYKNEAGLQAQLFQQYSNTLIGSAISEKGLLAVVSAAGDAQCVRMCEQYLRKWFGQRLAQCKVLVEVLAWIKHPMALQVLLSVANRFRTKAVRELANQFVKAVAEREGWTIDELADRTIPDAGFAKPEGGGAAALVLDYGPRQFTVALNDDLEPVIQGEGGKPLKALPAPGKADDAEKAKEAKKAFSDARKQVKEIVKRQSERLYEALCTQRAWRFEDWKRYLSDHPIVGRLCVRLAWVAFEPGEDGKRLGVFRPLEDGSLTNEADDAVTFPPDTLIRLGHTANVPAETAAAWRKHFADYDVTPPFDQFGREAYALPDAKKKETEVKDFEGHCLTTFQMRGKATKLGYVRGEAEDGGWFRVYRKPFPSLALQAEIEFTGSSLPEEDRAAALESLSFVRINPENESAGRWNRSAVELGKVPPVLLSECYNDLKQIAAEGPGFDPEWQKKSYY